MVSDLALPKSSGHFVRLSSLPSIEEHDKDLDNNTCTRPSHRRAPSASSSHLIVNKPRFSLKSIGSEPSNDSSDTHSTVSITSKDLLANMMQTHRDRDPYQYYTVLELIGQGSIGSVEKVVKKHHSLRSHTNLQETPNKKSSFVLAGIFHDCCVIAYDDENDDNHSNNKGHRREQSAIKSIFGSFLSKLSSSVSHRNADVFQSITFKPSPANTDSNRSIISENSCFSAPTTDVRPHLGSDFSKFDELLASNSSHGHRRWNSIRSDKSSPHHSPQHALRRYALKSIRLDRTEKISKGNAPSSADEAELRNEIAILRSLDHPHIVHIIETYEYRRSIYLLIDLCEGGDLYVMDPYSEGEARGIMKQLCQAVSYMHRKGVVHRDLKYENVMFVDCADRSRMSIKVS
jgi:serine/threonine protein kinase